MITVVTWKWGGVFDARYVNTLKSMLDRNLRATHNVVCVTDNWVGIDSGVKIVELPAALSGTPRCLRRLRQYDPDWAARHLGERFYSMDLDVVVTGDVTDIFSRTEKIVGWWVEHAQLYCGSFVGLDCAALEGMWRAFEADPAAYARAAQHAVYPTSRSTAWESAPWWGASDQVVLNYYLRRTPVDVGVVRESDGVVPYFGAGYRIKRPMATLAPGVRMVFLGSSDLPELEDRKYPWMEHWR